MKLSTCVYFNLIFLGYRIWAARNEQILSSHHLSGRNNHVEAGKSQSESQSIWKTSKCRRTIHWVQKVCHLEDTIKFYQLNFGFEICRHQEFINGRDTTCKEFSEGAYSRTLLAPEGSNEAESFCLELEFNYGINRYQHGSDLKAISISSSFFRGDSDSLTTDITGQKYIKTPDGYWINLIDNNSKDSITTSRNDALEKSYLRIKSDKFAAIKQILLHVSDLKSSIDFYENVLGATVEIINDQQTDLSALCTWDVSSSESELQSVLSHQVEVGLIQLPKGLEMDFRDSQGRLVIETEAEALEGILLRAKRAGKEASGQIIYGPNARHGEKELIVTDEDGHKFSFVEASEQRTIPLKLQGGDTVDWDLRDAVIKKALNEDEESYGPNIKILQESTYNFHVATIDEDMLINFSAPWCIMCTRNHPTYQELARRITEINGSKIKFSAINGSKIPLSRVENDDLYAMLQWTKEEGYPGLFYIRADAKGNPIEYDGEW